MESEFLEFRQRIKESIRHNMQSLNVIIDAPTSEQSKRKLHCNDFGSFFGPSQTVISSRVLRETKPLLQNDLSVAKLLNSIQSKTRSVQTSGSETKREQLKRKVEKLKDSRDYSFLLSDDAELPISIKESLSQNALILNSILSSKASTGSQMQPRPGSLANGTQPHIKTGSTRKSQTHKSVSKNGQPSSKLDPQRQLSSSKPLRSGPKQQRVQQRKVSHKLTSSEKFQKHQVKKKKKPAKNSSEDDLALQMVRKMFKTDRFAGRDFDDDDRGMEANFEDIIKEEKRSAKLAKKEDAEQLRLIVEEERRERVQKQKKQKLRH